MEITIKGNPGTGNTFIENNIKHIENNFPNVKEVTIIKGPDGKKVTTKTTDDATSNVGKRAEILRYAETTLPFVLFQWKGKYMDLWNDILDLKEVSAVIYDRKRQKNIDFNRYEFCHIINYIGKQAVDGYGIFEAYNATKIAEAFGDKAEKITRPQLYYSPSMAIRKAIDELLKSKKYATKTDK